MQHSEDDNLIGIGLYTIAEASRLLQINPVNIKRWLVGYHYQRDGEQRVIEPIWKKQIASVDNVIAVGFLDLMELRFVKEFRKHGVSLQAIRAAANRACDLFQSDHPFSRKRFRTDGRKIFAEIAQEEGEIHLLDLVRSQYAFKAILEPSLYSSMVYGESDDVRYWYPLHPKTQILLDPSRSFGRPIVRKGDVPTDVLASAAEVEGSPEFAAKLYDVPVEAVYAAIDFERRLAA